MSPPGATALETTSGGTKCAEAKGQTERDNSAPWAEWVERELEAAPPLSEATARRLSAELFGTGSSEAA